MALKIHPTAIVEEGALIGEGCEIGAYSVIRSSTVLGKNSTIASFCDIGYANGSTGFVAPLIIGSGSLIRSHSVIYAGCDIGEKFTAGHRVTIRENTRAGIAFQVGTGSDIQGDCEFGDYVKLHSDVHVSKKSKVGNFVWLFPGVILTNDPVPPSETLRGVVIDDFAVLAVGVKVMPGIKIGMGSLIGAGSLLKINAEVGALYSGNPAKKIGLLDQLPLFTETGVPAYPWNRRFSRGYPEDLVESWKAI